MAVLTITFGEPSPAPSNGYLVSYRPKGSSIAYLTATGTGSPIVIQDVDAGEYEGFVQSDCGYGLSVIKDFVTCTCATGYTRSAYGDCRKEDVVPAAITTSNICYARSQSGSYAASGTRIYTPDFTNADIISNTPSNVFAQMTYASNGNTPQWQSTVPTATPQVTPLNGPMNRASIWVDTDCDGTKDPLASGAQTTVAFKYTNLGEERTVYVGCGGDNRFQLKINDVFVAQPSLNANCFQWWHILPVTLRTGDNFFNIVGIGDGSTVDAVAMTIYDNTKEEIQAATSDAQLNILFASSQLAVPGQNVDIATCSAGYSLDTSAGQGNYICRRTLIKQCGEDVF